MIGQLTEDSYPSAQAFAEALVAVLGIPIDTISVIKGATGETGPKGARGEKGPAGNNGTVVTADNNLIAITQGAKYVDFDYTEDWALHNYKIILVGTTGGIGDYDPGLSGIVGLGCLVPVSGEGGLITKVRAYFTFQAGTSGIEITSVPSTNHRLSITRVITA